MIGLVDLKRQYACYREELEQAVQKVFTEVSFIGGEGLATFEAALSAYITNPHHSSADLAQHARQGAKPHSQPHSHDGTQPASRSAPNPQVHAIGCSSGTDALLLVLRVLGIGNGDEVIIPSYTFIAEGEVVALAGAQPVFVDVDVATYLIDPKAVAQAITERTKAIMPVGLFGVPADMDALNALAKKHNLTVIEDAAQSFGARYKGGCSGNLASFGCTSFFPAKPLGGAGDGGAIFVEDETYATQLRQLLNHGQSKRYHHDVVGLNARLDTLQAAVLNVKLNHLDDELRTRRRLADRYLGALDKNRYKSQHIPEGIVSTYAQYSFTCESRAARDNLIERLKKHGIGHAIYYPIPIHLQKAFECYGYKKGSLPITEHLAETMLSIPVHPFLTDEEQSQVIKVMNR